ncbi:MAG TPA: PLP-dependent aminotransferase family protein [Opitutaceae bacterium]|jgi:GntR family transcriptional regulator/MocR family aminotransferase
MPTPLLSLNLVSVSANREESLQQQLTEELRVRIIRGELPPGSRLPSSRELRRSLGVARNTVLSVYEQLAAEGYVGGRRGSGTYVQENLPDLRLRAAGQRGRIGSASPLSISPAARRLADAARGTVAGTVAPLPFRPCVPSAPEFPIGVWESLRRRVLNRNGAHLLDYAEPAGYRPLREAISVHVQDYRGVRCTPDEIIVTAGAQQAFHLIVAALVGPGDPVGMEDPGYAGFRSAALAAQAELIPMPVDRDGMVLPKRRLARPPVVIYMTPSRQFPLGVTMSLCRRLDWLEFAEKTGAWLIEDDYDSEHRYSGRPLPALQGLKENGRVLYVGTFSKTVFPSLRLGYIVAPARLVPDLVRMRAVLDGHSPSIDQAVLAEFMEGGRYARHLRRTQAIYGERLQVFRSEMESRLGGVVRLEASSSGLSLVGWLPENADSEEWAKRALAGGIEVSPISKYVIRTKCPAGIVFGFAPYPPALIRRSVEKLAKAWAVRS